MLIATAEEAHADFDLKRRIVNFLRGQNMQFLRRLEITANQGIVTMKGNVRSFHQRQLCIHCCQRVAGVVGIVDQIHVLPWGPSL